jgi:hypothetical protein
MLGGENKVQIGATIELLKSFHPVQLEALLVTEGVLTHEQKVLVCKVLGREPPPAPATETTTGKKEGT